MTSYPEVQGKSARFRDFPLLKPKLLYHNLYQRSCFILAVKATVLFRFFILVLS